ncbi:hypothetical protein [Clostridium grantii]|uniref:Uncharacterized protein n=1 Tax=Clostridium grantii DSM 8605 TaxID=1121316 RepID=A0A1M5QGM1_9CLOT|nr:hypothetical protein [Clostridium grantii]SHH13011.1 hypothetical protein SAMN02745207_00072 [Clostridium grantii DSM 8605]
MKKFKNPQKKNVYISLIISAIGMFMMLSVNLFEIDMMDGGGALIILGIFVCISGLVVAALFNKRARVLEGMFTEEKLLVHWYYDEENWEKYNEENYLMMKERNKALLILIGVIALFVGLVFLIVNPDDAGPAVFGVMILLVMVLAFVAFLVPKLTYNKNKKKVGEVYISSSGVFINGELHVWEGFGARFKKARYAGKEKNIIQFTYSVPIQYVRQTYSVNVPVPRGKEMDANLVLEYFKK